MFISLLSFPNFLRGNLARAGFGATTEGEFDEEEIDVESTGVESETEKGRRQGSA